MLPQHVPWFRDFNTSWPNEASTVSTAFFVISGKSILLDKGSSELVTTTAYCTNSKTLLVWILTLTWPFDMNASALEAHLSSLMTTELVGVQSKPSRGRKVSTHNIAGVDGVGVIDGVDVDEGVMLGVAELDGVGLGEGLQKGHFIVMVMGVKGGSDFEHLMQGSKIVNGTTSVLHCFPLLRLQSWIMTETKTGLPQQLPPLIAKKESGSADSLASRTVDPEMSGKSLTVSRCDSELDT